MKKLLIKFLLSLGLLFVVAQEFSAVYAQKVDIDFGDQDSVKDLTLLNKVKDKILAVLAWIICPVLGVVTAIKGWQMVGNAERGDKGAGAWVLIAGVLMAVLPVLFLELYKAMTAT
jgi:hypothetical protein